MKGKGCLKRASKKGQGDSINGNSNIFCEFKMRETSGWWCGNCVVLAVGQRGKESSVERFVFFLFFLSVTPSISRPKKNHNLFLPFFCFGFVACV